MTTITKPSAMPKTAAAKDAIELLRAHHQSVYGPFAESEKTDASKTRRRSSSMQKRAESGNA